MSYNYAKHVTSPGRYGVSGRGDLSTLLNNMGTMGRYAGYLTVGPALGDRYLLEVGRCNDESVEECVSKPKQIVVDNIPKGKLKVDTPFGAAKFQGLIPSIGEDMFSLAIPSDWKKRSSKKCIKRSASVGHSNRFTNVSFCGPNMGGGGSCFGVQHVLVILLILLLVCSFFSRQ